MEPVVTCVTAPSPPNWWPVIVGGIQFLIGLGLTIYTFAKSARQKTEERRASWYHKVVVDRALPLLFSYADSERSLIEKAAWDCEAARMNVANPGADIDFRYSAAVAEFQARLRPLRAEIVNIALVFDEELSKSVASHMLNLDDSMSDWFYQAKSQGTLRVTKTVGEILSDFHRDVLSDLRKYEFETLPQTN
jgi:hypothetical protein